MAQLPPPRRRLLYFIFTLRLSFSLVILFLFASFTQKNVEEYRLYPTSTIYSHTKSRSSGFRFPDVILCNSVKHDKFKLAKSRHWVHLPEMDQNIFDRLAEKFGYSGYKSMNKSYYHIEMGDVEDETVNYVAERRFDLPLAVEATMGNLTSADTQPDDFIVECWYEGANCSDWFEPFTSLSFGTCMNLSQRLQPQFTPVGKLQQGYQITFYRNSLKASGLIEPLGGVIVTVTDHEYLMVPEVESWNIPWSQGLEIQLQRREYTRVKNCREDSNVTEQLCSFMCLDKVFLNNCGCSFSPYMKDAARCTAETQNKCLPVIGRNWNQYIACNERCNTPCVWKGYSGIISSMNFPSESFTPYLIMEILDNKSQSKTAKAILEYMSWWKNVTEGSNITAHLSTVMMLQNIRGNFAFLHLLHGNNKELMQEKYIISFWTIFSNIGGNVGIWLGLSAFNVLDLIYSHLKQRLSPVKKEEKRKKSAKSSNKNSLIRSTSRRLSRGANRRKTDEDGSTWKSLVVYSNVKNMSNSNSENIDLDNQHLQPNKSRINNVFGGFLQYQQQQ